MKRIKSLLLFFTLLCLLLQACKKDKAEAPPPDPIAFYNYDNDYLTNSMSSLLHGSAVGNLSSTTDSFNTTYAAMQFAGDGYVKVEDSDLLDFGGNQFTIAVWIRPVKTKSVYVVTKSTDDNGFMPYTLDIYNGVVRSLLRTKTDEQFKIEGKSPILKEVWQHIAVTFNGEQLTVYYNGNSDGSVAVDRPLYISSGDLAIGAKEDSFPATAFVGKIDNVKIYDKALTAGQINYLYKNYKQ